MESSPSSETATTPAPKPEPQWAVVVVHGVGYTRPGWTLEAFVAALLNAPDNDDAHVDAPDDACENGLQELGPPEVRMLDELPPELPQRGYEDPPKLPPAVPLKERFPMHLRHVGVANARPGDPEKAVFAEVFWADLSTTRNRALSVLLRLVTIIFHLRFVADRAAKGPDGWGRWLRFFLYLASSLLCGPIAAVNIVILVLLVANLCGQVVESWLHLGLATEGIQFAMALAGLGAAAGAYWVLWKNRDPRDDNPWRLLLCWVIALGLAVVAMAAWRSWVPNMFAAGLMQRVAPTQAPVPQDEISRYVAALMLVMSWAFRLMELCVLLAILTWGITCFWAVRRAGRVDIVPGLTAGLCALLLQLGMWVLIIPTMAIWVFNKFFPDQLDQVPFERVQTVYVLHLGLAVFVGIFVGLAWLCRLLWLLQHRSDYHNLAVARAMPRLLLNGFILGALILVALVGTVRAIIGGDFFHDLLLPYSGWVNDWAPTFVTLVGLFLLNGLGYGLHILMDIVSHFIQPRLRPPWPIGREAPFNLNDLVREMRIEARLRRVLQEVLKGNKISHLTVVSHSQGTVIAIDVLWYDWTADMRLQKSLKALYLVTMGSPFTHLYQYYFPDRYPALFLPNGDFNADAETGWGRLHDTLQHGEPDVKWINLFRVDDPIGTHINGDGGEPGMFPQNHVLPPHGHTGYWFDRDALKLMKEMLPGR